MRGILILVVIVVLLAFVGWIKFSNTPQQSTITIDKEAVKEDTNRMVERGNEFVDQTRHAVGTERGATFQPVPPSDATRPTAETPPPGVSEQPAAATPDQTVR
jgi:hypothetical protein